MSYFLRYFIPDHIQVPSTSFKDGTFVDYSTEASFGEQKRFEHEAKIRDDYAQILAKCSNLIFKEGILNNEILKEKPIFNENYAIEVLKNAETIAPPSLFAANFLAWSETTKISAQFLLNEKPAIPENIFNEQFPKKSSKKMPFDSETNTASSHYLVTVGLDSVFSILLELNERDPELCAQSLQQLQSLLQVIPPEGMINESKTVVQRMADLLKRLRIEGNATVSANATSCLVALAVARGEPELLFSTIKNLLCDVKTNVPFNQIGADQNPLPTNFKQMALAVNKGFYSEEESLWTIPLTGHEEIAGFDLTFPGSLDNFSEPSSTGNVAKSCLVSDGRFVYVLNLYGFFKMGTGLTETLAGKIVVANELLKFREGSSLFICQDSLYLRRKHSSRLWVIDKETLREIGEIMLQATLTDGILFADGKNFFHGHLDEQWNFVTATLDDSFGILPNQKTRQSNRLVEFSYAVFGSSTDFQSRLIGTIPSHLQSLAIDLQLTDDTGFLLTRTGQVFYAGHAANFSLTDTGLTWTELKVPESIVQMHADGLANCLMLRSGAGHLWSVGSLVGLMENQLPHGSSHSRRFRKIRIPHKRKCSTVTGIHGAMGYVTDNGKCYLFGRHIVATNNDSRQLIKFEGFSIASLGIGKTHLVAISKSGLVYTCGLNNLNQCGRDELNINFSPKHNISQPKTLSKVSDPSNISSGMYCFPCEHLFIKDAASICQRCGKCSGKSETCPTKSTLGGLRKANLQRGMLCVCDSQESVCLRCGICQNCAESENLKRYPEDEQPEKEIKPSTFQGGQLQPARLVLQGDIKVSTVSCGNYHTILLCADRSVYTFGSNCHGQLGTGDTEKRSGAFKLDLPSNLQVVQAVAGANHCILRTLDGQILTFGAHKNGQLKRSPTKDSGKKWFAVPTIVEGFGQNYGKLVSWVGAFGDSTIIQIQKQTFSKELLSDSRITANKEFMVVLPPKTESATDYVVVKRTSGEINQFRMDSDDSIWKLSFGLDPHYPILWAYDDEAFKIIAFSENKKSENDLMANSVFSKTLSESLTVPEPEPLKKHRELLQITELAIPTTTEPEFSDSQMATFILTSIYSMSVLAALKTDFYFHRRKIDEKPGKVELRKTYKKIKANIELNLDSENGGCEALNRFDSFGGGWGYSAHCVEAIQFKVSKPIFICGIGLFGGRGEYAAKIKLLRLVGGDIEDQQCIELVSESDEIVYECAPRETAVIQFNKNVIIAPDEWHIILAQIQGPSSDCGASGRSIVKAAGDVEFTFRNSILSNNGTDVEVGQIPEIYYMLKVPEDGEEREQEKQVQEKLPLISPNSMFNITANTIASLFSIFEWSTKSSFTDNALLQDEEAVWKQERSAFISVISLRLLRLYISLLNSNEQDDADDDKDSDVPTKKNQRIDEFADLILDFSNILKNVFIFADERFLCQDKVGALVLEETVESYVACAELLLPSSLIVRNRLSQAMTTEQRNWSLLALLKACDRLESFALSILIPEKTNLGDQNDIRHAELGTKLCRHFFPSQIAVEDLTGSAIIRFLFDISFAVSEQKKEDILFNGFKKAAQNLICLFAKALVTSSLKMDSGPPLLATDNRFRRFNSHLNWETGNGAYDAIAFKVDSRGITIHGIGIFVGQAIVGDFSYELETFVNTGDLANECWSLIDQQTGTVKDSNVGTSPHRISSQKVVTGIKLTKPIFLKPEIIYAVRIHLSAGKTFYGENGQAIVRLSNNAKLQFMPCGLSRNGTSLVRGQVPYLIYSVEEVKNFKIVVPKEKSRDNFWEVEDKTQNLFIEITRLLSQKMSYLAAMNEIGIDEKIICSKIIVYSAVFLETNPNLGFHLISSFDEIIPLLTSANAEEIKKNDKFLCSTDSREFKLSQNFTEKNFTIQALIESPHPYRPAQILSQTLVFEPQTEFVCIRFHDDCQTASPDDILWIYAAQPSNSNIFYPIGKYFGSKIWPETQLLIPGFKLWFIFESSLPSENVDVSKMYGFRVTVDGFCSRKDSIITQINQPSNSILEQEFVWLCSTALRNLIQIPKNLKESKKLEKKEYEIHELIKRHGSLLKKGLDWEDVPSIRDVIYKNWPAMNLSHEKTFLNEFIDASISTSPGRLARAFSFVQSFIDLALSTIEIEATEVIVGKPIKLILVQKDQFNKDARCTNLVVDISISAADDIVHQDMNQEDLQNQNSPQNCSTSTSLDDQHWKPGKAVFKDGFQTLRQLQLKEKFASVYLNKARYKTITMMPMFANFSLEELRLAFQQSPAAKEDLKLQFSNQLGNFVVDWRPKKSGRFRIDCKIDGFKLLSTTFIEVSEIRAPSTTLLSPKNLWKKSIVESTSDLILMKPKIARFDTLSSFSAVRIRIHPSLTAPSIGKIPRGSSVTFIEAIKNAEGTWLKLTDEAKTLFCDKQQANNSAWCLQYHQDFEATLLDVDESDLFSPKFMKSPVIIQKSPRRQLPPLPKPPKLQSELSEDADILTIHRQSLTLNSSSSSLQIHEALGPRVMDTCRSVFAAVVWHELLVNDLIACSNHLKSSPHLEQYLADPANPALPSCFSSLIKLYKSTVQSVLEVVEQHLILPSPPSMKQLTSRQLFPPPEELCELCHELRPKPITVHMREKHPGCGGPCGGHGYNSIGKYTTGWTGICGDGGRSNAVWYLLCPSCRTAYLSKAFNQRISSMENENDWAQLRQKTANKQCVAETILKQNAMFLLELRPTEDKDRLPSQTGRKSGRYKVNLYPQASTALEQTVKLISKEAVIVENEAVGNSGYSPLHHISHQSDPGAANDAINQPTDLFSLSASANLFRQPNTAQPPLFRPQRLASLNALNELLRHPVLVFCTESHDLAVIKKNIKSAIARSVKFAYAFRAWNWLLKLVTSETTVTDVVWSYLTALGSYSAYNHWLNADLKLATKLKLLPHPWRLCFLAGPEANSAMIREFHNFLGTLAVIVQSNAVGISLKCLCFKAWTFQLTVHEQNLLITLCNILSAVGAVLSNASGDIPQPFEESALSILAGLARATTSLSSQMPSRPSKPIKRLSSSHIQAANRFVIKQHENLSNKLQIDPSSRNQLIHCLIDGNLETFWESGEEDKNRSRKIEINWDDSLFKIDLLAIFVDNIRDANFKTTQFIVKNFKMVELMNSEVDWSFVGWLKVVVFETDGIQIVLKGSENGCRIRQIVAFGQRTTGVSPLNAKAERLLRPSLSHQLFFSTAQMDAFVLFQAIAAQAFSDELAEEQNGTLRQQVIDLLFNRVQLQPLQSYVCFQMVSAVEREIVGLRDHSKRNYSYISGLMMMLVKICESRKDLEIFSSRNGLLNHLSELVLFAPSIVQSQAIETMAVLLRHFKPQDLTFIKNILAAIAKAISLQIKDKTTRTILSQKLETFAAEIPMIWRIDRPINLEVAQQLIKFINKISLFEFGDQWAFSVKMELANHVMNLSQLLTTNLQIPEPIMNETSSKATLALRSHQFWLIVAALCLINDPSWLELSPTFKNLKVKKSQEPDSLCENHDDGQTLANFKCENCEINLCRECFTILHLNKRKKSHVAKLISCTALCPKVDVHEGCTRLQISNLLILVNTSKLSGMVEISSDIGGENLPRSSSFSNWDIVHTAKCRFCSANLTNEADTLLGICNHPDCLHLASEACIKILPCGHFCGGIKDEKTCLPCFTCEKRESKQDADDLCVICFVDRLRGAPCIKLSCGHLFHFKCVRTVLEKRWAGPRILFRFMHCPLCNAIIDHPDLKELLDPLKKLYQDVSEKARLRLEYDGFPTDNLSDATAFAMDKYVYVLCSKCGKAYFGGESSCQEALESSINYNAEDLLCGGCSDVAGAEICGRHGAEYLEYKCRFCCSVAVYFCFGSTHFCAGCHSDFQRLMPLAKHQLPQCPVGPRCIQLQGDECPLKIKHPPTGDEFSLGCGICRNIRTF